MATRTFDIPARGHSLAATLREIDDAGGTATRVELKPQSPFSGDPEFDSTDLSAWTQDNIANATTIDAHTSHPSRLMIEGNANACDWLNATRSGPFVRQTITGDFDVYCRISSGRAATYTRCGILAQSTSDATDWICNISYYRSDAATDTWYLYNTTNSVTSQSNSAPAAKVLMLGGTLFLRLKRSGNDFSSYFGYDGKTWTQLSTTFTRSDFSSDAKVGFYFANDSSTANVSTVTCDYMRTWPPYDTTSPVGSVVIDSGVNGTTWDMSTFDALINPYVEDAGYRDTVGAGTLKYKYGASDSNPPSLNGSYLTEAQMQSETDPSGRYFKLEVQYISANGYEQAVFCGATIDGTFGAFSHGRGTMRGAA